LTLIKKTPLVITWHEVWGNYWYAYLGSWGAAGKYIELLVSRITPHTIAVSQTTAAQLEKISGALPTSVIPNGVDLNRIRAVPPAPERSDLLFAGRLIKEKHVDLLIDACAILLQENPDLTLLIVGEGPEQENLISHIREKGLGDRVRIRGFVAQHDDLIALMKSTQACVLPSTREGFGITALEALACGVPVVTAHHPANAIRDLITPKTGFLCALTAEDLATAIREAQRRGAGMRDDCIAAAADYDWDRIADSVETYYRSVISGGRAGTDKH
ncbi:MAG: glycosyltransferase family 4 protein, partial [Methanoregula sp.]|nr:glycosyltransferase family 4 protein [Methanoregula sp.]